MNHVTTTTTTMAQSPPPPTMAVSGKGPNWGKHMMHCIVCVTCLLVLLWIACFVVMCILLHRANTLEVRVACPGFWDFMLISLLTPFLIPTIYCIFSFVMWWSWYPFLGSCMLIMGVMSLFITLNAMESPGCVETIRSTTTPVPWLIYVGILKTVIYCAGSLSSLCGHVVKNDHEKHMFII